MYRAVLWIRDVVIASALAWIGVTVTLHSNDQARLEAEQRIVYGADDAGVCETTTVSLSANGNCVVVLR